MTAERQLSLDVAILPGQRASRQWSSPLSDEDWAYIRLAWETDPRFGVLWLIKHLALPCSKETLIKRGQSEQWSKIPNRRYDQALFDDIEDRMNTPSRYAKHEAEDAKILEDSASNVVPATNVDRPESPFNDDAYREVMHLAKLGATLEDIADFFEVSPATIVRWQNENPQFKMALKRGRIIADAAVAASLYNRAVGFQYDEVTEQSDQNGGFNKTVTKQALPDVAAAKFWLTNRQPHLWKEKVEVKEQIEISLGPSKDELDAIYERANAELAAQNAMLAQRMDELGLMGIDFSETPEGE